MIGDDLVLWSVRVSVALYVLALVLRCRCPSAARLAWTAGLVLFLLHVAAAFHFAHGWSHAHAYHTTARRTADLTGVAWGGGLYANYLFGLVWLADAGWWWAARKSYEARSYLFEWAVHGYLAFIAFNATVVFGSPLARAMGLAACLLVFLCCVWPGRPHGREDDRPALPHPAGDR